MGKGAGDDADKGGLEDLGFETSAFEALERDFQEVLTELVGDKSLEKFRKEYEKLHKALKKSHDQEKKLIKRCRELNSEIVNNAAKVQTALKLSQEDQHTISSLKKEIEKAWKMVDASHDKEQRAKETIQQLKLEIANLSRLVEQGAGLSVGQDNTVQELLKVREDLMKESKEKDKQIDGLKELQNDLNGQIEELETDLGEKNRNIKELKDEILQKSADQERENRRKERLDKELKDLKKQLETKQIDLDRGVKDLEASNTQVKRLQAQLKDTRMTMEKQVQSMDGLYQRTTKLAEELDTQLKANQETTKDLHKVEAQIKRKDHNITALKNDITAKNRVIDKLKKSVEKAKQKSDNLRKDKSVLNHEVGLVKKQVDDGLRREEELAKKEESLGRAIEIKEKLIIKEVEKGKVVLEEVEMLKRQIRSLESEKDRQVFELSKMRKIITSLEKEREKLHVEAAQAAREYVKSQDEIKLKEVQIKEHLKKVTEGEAKSKAQQTLYENVRTERNLYSKNLIEKTDEIAEMNRKFKIMKHQIEQLKEEIIAKDRALVKEHFDHKKVEKMADQYKQELAKMKKLLEEQDKQIRNQDKEILKLTTMIGKYDQTSKQQRGEFDQILAERDILGTQLIRRNDELALLYEKVKIMQSTLRKGEAQYQERMQDIRILRLKIGDLTRELHISKNRLGNIGELKREVYQLQHELLQEKTKVKALSEELENPMNVHRWRKLEGSDPATYEMIQKIQTLQKRLISKTEEVVEKDLLIQEKEKLYIELKNILARQPGPEVAEQLSVYQQNLKEKTRQMKAMASELNMYQAQVNEYKYERERLSRELQMVKKKYYEQKRKEQMNGGTGNVRYVDANTGQILDASDIQKHQQQLASSSYQSRFTGGGFNLQA